MISPDDIEVKDHTLVLYMMVRTHTDQRKNSSLITEMDTECNQEKKP